MKKILAYTCSYGDRNFLPSLVPAIRGSAGVWFDWAVFLGAPSDDLRVSAEVSLEDPKHLGIQYLQIWEENRGQHHATNGALKIAREGGYDWLLRVDDDIKPKTKKFLEKMLNRLEDLKTRAEDDRYRIVAAPKVIGLKNPLPSVGLIHKGQSFVAETMELLGGACRLHPMELLEGYEAPIYEPVGRGDPESMLDHVLSKEGIMVRFPDIRIYHDTRALERLDTASQTRLRRMSKIWPWLETADL